MKDKYGEDNIVNISTIKTEGPKSTILTVCRGLGINGDEASAIASLVKVERGQAWSISDMLYGNEEKERKPIKEFVNEINKYEHLNLREAILKVEGLINGRSIHACGIMVYNNGYINGNNAIMKSPNGLNVTAYTMKDSEAVGNLKYDSLTTEVIDKLQITLELLLKDKVLEDKGSLRENYNAYIHPDVLEYDNDEVWKLSSSGKVLSLFQFQTALAQDCLMKAKPRNLVEMAHINSLLRLSVPEGEQPIDQFVRYRNNISEWYKDMREYGLNEDEIKVLEEHLLELSGICATQEDLMEMCQNPKIANFDLTLSNKIRKSIAKKSADLLEESKEIFFAKGIELGAREVFLNYVWYEQFKKQFGLIA